MEGEPMINSIDTKVLANKALNKTIQLEENDIELRRKQIKHMRDLPRIYSLTITGISFIFFTINHLKSKEDIVPMLFVILSMALGLGISFLIDKLFDKLHLPNQADNVAEVK